MEEDEVLVYLYTFWDEKSQSHKTSTEFATVDGIRNGLGIPVYTSGRKVPRSQLIDGDRYVPAPEEFLKGNPMAVPVPKAAT